MRSDSERLVLEPTAISVVSAGARADPSALPGTVTLGGEAEGAAAMYLRFAPEWVSYAAVESAFLLLEPMPSTLVDREDVEVVVWRVSEDWNAAEVSWRSQPDVSPPRARGIARSSPPSTLRIDVTNVVRYLKEHRRSDHGIAVKASAQGAHGATYATGATGDVGPRLEVYVHAAGAPGSRTSESR